MKKQLLLFITILMAAVSSMHAQYTIMGYKSAYCPDQQSGDMFYVKPYPATSCFMIWTVTNGVFLENGVSYGRKTITGNGLFRVTVRWDNVAYNNGTMPKGKITLASPCFTTFNKEFIIASLNGVTPTNIKLNGVIQNTLPYGTTSVALEVPPLYIPNTNTYVSDFEWTLPSGWQTTEGQTGVFQAKNFISIIPPSCAGGDIKCRAVNKNCGLSTSGSELFSEYRTLSISRTLPTISVTPNKPMVYWGFKDTVVYRASKIDGITSYEWTLASGWKSVEGGSSTTFNTTADSIRAILTGCDVSPVSVRANICGNYTSMASSVSLNYIFPKIMGSDVICSTESYSTYYLTDYRANLYVVWRGSENLVYNEQHDVAFSVRARTGNSDAAWIDASVANPYGCSINSVDKFELWIGKPKAEDFGIIGIQEVCTYYTGSWDYSTSIINGKFKPTTFEWEVPVGMSIVSVENNGQSLIAYVDNADEIPVGGAIRLRGSNICGWSGYAELPITKSLNCTDNVYLSPNPASDYVTVTVASGDGDVAAKAPASEATLKSFKSDKYKVSLLNGYGWQVYKNKETEKSFTISTSTLHDGIYLLKIEDGKKVYWKRLIVRH